MKRAKKKPEVRRARREKVLRHEEGFHEFEIVRRNLRNTIAGRLFGFELDVLEPGRAVMSMRVRGRHLQLHGVVHGGMLAALADTAGAIAAYPMLPRGTRLATIEMSINYLEAVAEGAIVAEGRVVRLGRNFAVSECDIRDHNGRLVAKSLLSFAIRLPKDAPPTENKQKK